MNEKRNYYYIKFKNGKFTEYLVLNKKPIIYEDPFLVVEKNSVLYNCGVNILFRERNQNMFFTNINIEEFEEFDSLDAIRLLFDFIKEEDFYERH